MKKKILIVALIIGIVSFLIIWANRHKVKATVSPYPGSIYQAVEDAKFDYYNYLQNFEDKVYPNDTIAIDAATNYRYHDNGFNEECYITEAEGYSGLYIPETGNVSWDVEIATSGLYNIEILYYPISGRSAAISRGIKIDGAFPFKEAASFVLSRIWVDQFNVESQRQPGNHDLKPSQIE